MKIFRSVYFAVGIVLAAGVVVVQLVTAQPAKFAAEAKTFADVNSVLNGTWTLKQRKNPDGTPYRSKLEGVTYISVHPKTGDSIGPHATATLYSKESGIADTHFFNFSPEIANKPFTMESSGTWLIQNVQNTAEGGQVSAHVVSMTKGDLQPYKNGMVFSADIRYNVARTAPRAGAAAVPKVSFLSVTPGDVVDFSGNKIEPTAMTRGCGCGVSSLSVMQNQMDIGYSNKASDVWVKSNAAVPTAFR